MIDSWAWIEYWRGGRRAQLAAEHIDGDEEALVSAVNVAEIYHWFLTHYDEKVAEERRNTVETRCLVASVDADLAVRAARVKREEGMSLADSIVLATGRIHAARVVTGDPDFKGRVGVEYIGA